TSTSSSVLELVGLGCAVKRQHLLGPSVTGSMLPLNCFFFFIAAASTGLYTLSLHDALPISRGLTQCGRFDRSVELASRNQGHLRSEEHTSELQSRENLVCRLLLEKKNWPPRPTTAPC